MIEVVHENFSTPLLCMYFARVREGRPDLEQPRVYFGPSREESQSWGELFPLDRGTEVWMCRRLEKTLGSSDVQLTKDRTEHYTGLEPDVRIQDEKHAIVIENKRRRRDMRQENSYLDFLRESSLNRPTRTFLYCVPEAWLPNRKDSEWWKFVREKNADDPVLRGIIAWDGEFVDFLCTELSVPEW